MTGSALNQDCSIKEAYTVEVKNRFEALYQDIENHAANDIYSALMEAHEGAATKYVPKRNGKKKTGAMGKRKDQGETEMPLKEAYNKKNGAPTA